MDISAVSYIINEDLVLMNDMNDGPVLNSNPTSRLPVERCTIEANIISTTELLGLALYFSKG